MANEIELVITSDDKSAPGIRSATDGVRTYERTVSESAGKVKRSNEDVAGSFDKVGERADDVDTKAMGFRDTMTGVQDTMAGTAAIARGDLFTGFLTLGMGVGDLASGMFNFLVPTIKKAVIAMRAFNITMLANPIGIVIAAAIALVAAFVLLYKKNETFRRAVDNMGRAARRAFGWVLNAARSAVSWISRNWQKLLLILTGPIGIAVALVVKHFGKIRTIAGRVVSAIKRGFSGLYHAIVDPIVNAVNYAKGLLSGLIDYAGSIPGKIADKVRGVVPGFAHGGIIGAASGGPRSGLVMVGEHGRELIKVPPGSRVYSNPDTERMIGSPIMNRGRLTREFGPKDVSGMPVRDADGPVSRRLIRQAPAPSGRAGGVIVIQLRIGDRDLGDIIVDPLRRTIRKRGGNVQAVLGTS